MISNYTVKYRRGFTLIELLVVIVIIGLLTTLATTSYLTAQRNSRDNARKVRLSGLANGIETYYRVNQKFPGQIGTSTPPDANYQNNTNGCEKYDSATWSFVYSYFPTDPNAQAAPQQSCDKRNSGAPVTSGTYTFNPALYKPYPDWIPGLGEYVNPMPIETRYMDSAGTDTATYDLSNDPFVTAANKQRTFVYRKLLGGYLLYVTLENNSDRDILPQPQAAFTDAPHYPNGSNVQLMSDVQNGGSGIFMIRK